MGADTSIRSAEASTAVIEAEAMADAHLARREELERLGKLVRWLEDIIRIPGTKFGLGLDAALGALLPGVGDAVTGVTSVTLVAAAVRVGVPGIVVARMLLNIAVDTIGGLIPVVGDVFDLLWRSNRRNLELLERHRDEMAPRAQTSDYLWVGLAIALCAVSVAAPFVFAWWLVAAVL